LAFILVTLTVVSSCAQPVTIEPEKPIWGKDLIVTYDPSARDAVFSFHDAVYVIGWLYFPDSSTQMWHQMERKKDRFQFVLSIPEQLSYVVFHFITFEGWDENASVETMIYRPDGVPARGAYQYSMLYNQSDYVDRFDKELRFYPDNFAVYRDKWWLTYAFSLGGAFSPESVSTIVTKDLEKLHAAGQQDCPDLLYALSYGYLMLGQEVESRVLVEQLLRLYPETEYAHSAVGDYQYKTYEMDVDKQKTAELKVLLAQTIEKYPHTPLARDIVPQFVCNDTLPLAAIEAVCNRWASDEPLNPAVYRTLANAYKCRNEKLDSAAALIAKAIDLSTQGYLRFYEDLSGQYSHYYLCQMHRTAAEIALKLGDDDKSLYHVEEAQQMTDEADEGRDLLLLEAQIQQRIGEGTLAHKAYYKAWQLGSAEARDSLQAMYLREQGSLEGFDSFLKIPADDGDRKPAPDFKVTSLEGEKFELSRLQGKVVVLNFWAIGCVQCRVEIPSLNTLVDTFRDQNVVFLALAPDSKKSLKKFLNDHPFRYAIIPGADKTIRSLSAWGYPVHIIIDKHGRIAHKLFGGSKDRHHYLQPLIERLLEEPG
jgi:peroxiredoxin